MSRLTQAQITEILAKHSKWRRGYKDGERANLSGAILSGADLSRADLSRADLSRADLSRADLSGAILSRADLSRADLSRADLSRADLSRANLSRADLSRANLSGADLSRADLSRADLSRADLSRADLSRADLSRANLSRADLSRANLSRADLSRADLSRANLSRAILSRANLSGANLYGAGLPLIMTVEAWCDAHDLATLPDGRRIAFKRLPASMTTGAQHGHAIKWKRGLVKAPDWNPAQVCGGGLHLSPTPRDTRSYSNGEICVPVAFAIEDAVHLGDKLKVKRCWVLLLAASRPAESDAT